MKTTLLGLGFALLMGQAIIAQYTLQGDDVIVENGVIQSCSYDFMIKDIVIPDTLNGQRITGIADQYKLTGVFAGKALASICLPVTLEKIGSYAFYNNRVWNIDINLCTELISIGDHAFSENDLSVLDLGASKAMISIGNSAFHLNNLSFVNLAGCTALSYIGGNAFKGRPGDSLSIDSFILPTNDLNPDSAWLSSNGNKYVGGEAVSDLESSYYIPVPYVLKDHDVILKNGVIESCSYLFRKDVVIPDTLDGQMVTGIDCDVFHERDLESIVLPSGLTHIGPNSFGRNKLTALDLPPTLISIGNDAFGGNYLSSISLPPTMEFIGRSAFQENQLTSIGLKQCTSLVSIGPLAFASNWISDVDFSNCSALVSMGGGAFLRNQLDSIDLSACSALISIGASPYPNDSIFITLPVNSEYSTSGWRDKNDSLFAGGDVVNDLDSYYYLSVSYTLRDDDVEVSGGYIQNTTGFIHKIITIPDTLDGQAVLGIVDGEEDRGYWGVFAARNIKSLELPSTIEHIGNFAFSNCGIEQVDFTRCSALRAIGERAFQSNKLTELELSQCSDLLILRKAAFSGNELTQVNLPSSIEVIERYAFLGTDSFDGFQLPVHSVYEKAGWKDENDYSYTGGDFVNDLETRYYIPVPYTLIDDDVEVVNGHMVSCSYDFYQKEIVVPDTLDGQAITGIDYQAFYFREIKQITLPGELEILKGEIFWGNEITEIDLSHLTSLTFIDLSSFRNDDGLLKGFELPNHALYDDLGWKDYEGNNIPSGTSITNLGTSYFIPATYTLTDDDVEVLDGVIQSCNYNFGLKQIIIHDTLDGQVVLGIADGISFEYRTGVFEGKGIQSISLPSALRMVGIRSFGFNELDTLDLNHCPDLESIGDQAFQYNNLSSLKISACMTLTNIGSRAFSHNRISNLILPASVEKIGSYAFFYNPLIDVNLGECTSLSYLGYSSMLVSQWPEDYEDDNLKSITLPEHSTLKHYGWRDFAGTNYNAGDSIGDLWNSYYIPAPYTLTDDDVEVLEGMIQSCSYNFALLHIIIPDTLDGQVVRGIADGEPWDFSFGRMPTGVFEGKEIVDVALPNTIERIGVGSFRLNRISNLDLSACSSLSSLGVHAFYKNPLEVIDLLACNSLISIDYQTFYNYSGTSEFQLPAPDLPGYLFRHWVDSYQNIYNEGDLVRNFTLSYTAVLSELFSVLIQVTDGNLPIQRAEVVFEGFDTLVTDSSGRIEIAEILPPTTLVYTITAEGYDPFTDSISVHDKDVSVVVALELTTFSVFITVTDGTDPIEGAEVSMGSYGKTVTGAEGEAVFDSVRPWEKLTCTVSAPGFIDASIILSVADGDFFITIILNRITGLNEVRPSEVRVYPNPSSEKVYLKLHKKANVQLIDTSGEVIMEKECSSGLVSLDVSHIPSGNYLIRIHMQNTTMIRKLVVL